MSEKLLAYASDGIYIPIHKVTESQQERVESKFTRTIYHDEKTCESCDMYSERPSEVCDTCQNFGGDIKLWSRVDLKSGTYLRLPYGARARVEKVFGPLALKYRTPIMQMKYKPNFTGKLRPDQRRAVQAMLNTTKGVMRSPPRSGKCLVGSTLVMTNQGLTRIDKLVNHTLLSPGSETVLQSKGMTVATYSGEKQVRVRYSKIVDKTVAIRTYEGVQLEGTPDERVLTASKGFSLKWKQLKDLSIDDYVVLSRRQQWLGTGDSIRTWTYTPHKSASNELLFKTPKTLSPELARLLGYWIANGSLSVQHRIGFCSANKEVILDFLVCMKKVFPEITLKNDPRGELNQLSFSSSYVKSFLKVACDLSMTKASGKYIPSVLLQADKKYLTEFLSAYLSCDSWIHKFGIQLCTASNRLARELQSVLFYYGIVGRRLYSKGGATNGLNIERTYWSVHLHRIEAEKLLSEIKIRKPFNLSETTPINQHDVVPFVKETLAEFKNKFCEGKTWSDGKITATVFQVGGIIYPNKKGVTGNKPVQRSFRTCINKKLLRIFDRGLETKLDSFFRPDIYYSKVVSVKEKTSKTRVYDLEVPEGNHFLANSIVAHNTVMGAAFVCELAYKTIILAAQKEWLDGFHETFVGSESQKALTDIKKSRIGYPKTLEDFNKYDVCLVTYQKFLSKSGKQLLKKVRRMFTVLLVDEVQTVGAKELAGIVSQFKCRYKIGVSGTPERKDSKEFIIYDLLGPIFFDNKVERMRPTLEVVHMPTIGKLPQSWTYMVTRLESNPYRLKVIAKEAVKDVKNRHLVLIPLQRTKVIKALAMAINRLAGEDIAVPFYGGTKERKEVIQDLRAYRKKVVVGTMRLLATGTNIPRASMIYQCTPSANIPKAEQRFSRVLTPYEGKPDPVFKYFLDDVQVVKSCLSKEHWHCVVPTFRPKVSNSVNKKLTEYMKKKRSPTHDFPSGVI